MGDIFILYTLKIVRWFSLVVQGYFNGLKLNIKIK